MNLLEGSIAFALALAGFATLCTILIEVFHRFAGLRAKGLRTLLLAYFDGELKKDLPQDLAAKAEDLKKRFLADLTANALIEQLSQRSPLFPLWLRRRLLALDALSKANFLARLPQTEAYKSLQAATGKTEAVLLQELGDRYDHYCDATTSYFKARAHLLSLVAGVALAFLGNIHSGRIFDTFIKNPDLAQRMEAQAGNIRSALATNGNGSTVATAVPPTIGEELAKVQNTLKDYQNMGLPIGWTYYPNCFGDAAGDPRCEAVRKQAASEESWIPVSLFHTANRGPLAFVQWFCVVLVTGLLIGLGGPFWYDLAVKLSNLRALFNGKAALPEQQPPHAPKAAAGQ